MKFKETFYKEVEKKIPENLLKFWGRHNLFHFALNYKSFSDFLRWSIDSTFEKLEESKLSDDIPNIREAHRSKRRTWRKRYYEKLKLGYSNPEHPLHLELLNLQQTTPFALCIEYQDLTIDEILAQKVEEKTKEVEDWKKSKTLFLTDFPVMNILTPEMKENALRDDIVRVACDYIVKDLRYNFSATAKLLPSPIINKPIFSINSTRIDLEEINGIIQSVIQNNNQEGSSLTVYPVSGQNTQMRSLDKKDLAVYQEITKLAIASTITQNGKIVVEINPYTIAANIGGGYAVGIKEATAVLQSIDKLASRRFVYCKNEETVEYILIDSIYKNISSSDDKVYYPRILLGNFLSDSIMNKDIIGVSKKLEDKIHVSNGKHFLHPLQAKRFETYRDTPNNMTVKLKLNFFEESVFFSTKSYKKKIAIIMECLDDFILNEILIKNYTYEDDVFTLKFFTLDDDDKQYYSDWLINHKG